MTLHLIKLCVGTYTIKDLENWIQQRARQAEVEFSAYKHAHITRMMPRRKEELLAGGSLFWVIKGHIQARQQLLDIRKITDKQGVQRCEIVMSPKVIPTRWQPRRAFQGWRYFKAEDAPPDLQENEDASNILQGELAALGLI